MAIKYYLRKNRLSSDADNYNAVVLSRGSVSLDDLIQMMIQEGSRLTPEDIRLNCEFMTRATIALLLQGFRVTTPVARLSPSIQGVFNDSQDVYDSRRHNLRLNASVPLAVERRWRSNIQVSKTAYPPRIIPLPNTYHDVGTSTHNAILTPNSVGRVTGQYLKLEASDEQQGVFFIAEDGSKFRAPMYVTIKPAQVIFTTPALDAGEYTLRVCAKVPGSKEKVRCGELEHTLTVA